MVLKYYNLRQQPFGVTPDTRFSYLGATHREALASLTYGIGTGRGFMALIAKPGMGKTTLLFHLLRKLENSARTVFLFQTLCTPQDFLRSLLADLGIDKCGNDFSQMHSCLNHLLLQESRAGRRLVVAIDEAQNLDPSVLEVVRMLSNFETSSQKLMQIILAGQPQLGRKLASPELVQLRQRISILTRLKPLSAEDTLLYILHRLRIAGYAFDRPLFSQRALQLITQHGEGIPRNINNLCFNSLSLGYALQQKTIGEDVVCEVLADAKLDFSDLDEPAQAAPDAPVMPEDRVQPMASAAATASRAQEIWMSSESPAPEATQEPPMAPGAAAMVEPDDELRAEATTAGAAFRRSLLARLVAAISSVALFLAPTSAGSYMFLTQQAQVSVPASSKTRPDVVIPVKKQVSTPSAQVKKL